MTLEYQPEQQRQPPFSVGEMEVRTLFERHFQVEVLGRAAELDHPGCCRVSSPTSTRWPTGWCAVQRLDQKRELRR